MKKQQIALFAAGGCLLYFLLTGVSVSQLPEEQTKSMDLPCSFEGNPAVTYKPTVESLATHKSPQWFNDAKFGIFIHWGLYSVPAYAPPIGEFGTIEGVKWVTENPYAEWYMNTMRYEGKPTWKYHRDTYGEKFDYMDFAPIFNKEIEKWNPTEWAHLFSSVGARYVVLTSKHHEGFLLWPSEHKNPHRKPDLQHSSRDIVGELTDAVRAAGMHMGLYYSGGFDWSYDYELPEGRMTPRTPITQEYADAADYHLE